MAKKKKSKMQQRVSAAVAKKKAKDAAKGSSSKSSSSSSSSSGKTKTSAGYETPQETMDRIKASLAGGTAETKEEKTKEAKETKGEEIGTFDPDAFRKTAEYQALPPDQQDAVLAVYSAIGQNNKVAAGKLIASFQAATKLAKPYFAQQLRLAKDELERGFVAIGKEKEFKETSLRKRLQDLRTDVANKRGLLSLEETAQLKEIDRSYTTQLKDVRQDLAATGMSSSMRRAETENLLSETTGDLRESTRRRFGSQIQDLDTGLVREERDTSSEIERLTEVAKSSQLDIFRQGEKTLGTSNLPNLAGMDPLGGIAGGIPEDQTRDILNSVQNLIF